MEKSGKKTVFPVPRDIWGPAKIINLVVICSGLAAICNEIYRQNSSSNQLLNHCIASCSQRMIRWGYDLNILDIK